jgi:PIN domain nuclease of toxin-antitoxin system
MKLLLDTCTFLWLVGDGALLSRDAADAIRTPANEVFVSAASAWEIVTKHARGRLPLPEDPERLIPTERRLRRIGTLAFDEEAALQGTRLPWMHRDPFDRMLIAQAIAHGLAIVTPDPLISQYPVRVIW